MKALDALRDSENLNAKHTRREIGLGRDRHALRGAGVAEQIDEKAMWHL